MSPVVLPPVSTAYCSLSRAPRPASVMYQPVGSVVFVVLPAVFESVTKVSVGMGASSVVSEMRPVPVSLGPPVSSRVDAGAFLMPEETGDFVTAVLSSVEAPRVCAEAAGASRMACWKRRKAAVRTANSWRRVETERRPLRGKVGTDFKSFLDLECFDGPAVRPTGETRTQFNCGSRVL